MSNLTTIFCRSTNNVGVNKREIDIKLTDPLSFEEEGDYYVGIHNLSIPNCIVNVSQDPEKTGKENNIFYVLYKSGQAPAWTVTPQQKYRSDSFGVLNVQPDTINEGSGSFPFEFAPVATTLLRVALPQGVYQNPAQINSAMTNYFINGDLANGLAPGTTPVPFIVEARATTCKYRLIQNDAGWMGISHFRENRLNHTASLYETETSFAELMGFPVGINSQNNNNLTDIEWASQDSAGNYRITPGLEERLFAFPSQLGWKQFLTNEVGSDDPAFESKYAGTLLSDFNADRTNPNVYIIYGDPVNHVVGESYIEAPKSNGFDEFYSCGFSVICSGDLKVFSNDRVLSVDDERTSKNSRILETFHIDLREDLPGTVATMRGRSDMLWVPIDLSKTLREINIKIASNSSKRDVYFSSGCVTCSLTFRVI